MDGVKRWLSWGAGCLSLAWAAGTVFGATPHPGGSDAERAGAEALVGRGIVEVGAAEAVGAVDRIEPGATGAEATDAGAPPVPQVDGPAPPEREKEGAGEQEVTSTQGAGAAAAASAIPEAAPAGTPAGAGLEGARTPGDALPLGERVGSEGGPHAAALEGLGVARTLGAVAVVVALIVLVRVLLVRAARLSGGGIRGQLGAGGRAPSGIVQILGRYPVARGQTLVLMKLDRRVLLLSQTSAGFTTLSEITEADDVASILRQARDEEGESMAARFGALLRRLERDPRMGEADDVEIAPYLQRPSLDEVEGLGATGTAGEDDGDPGAALRRRLEGLRGLSA